MGYLGNPVTKDFTSSTSVQTLSGDGSSAYALSASVSVPEDIAVLRNGVRQKPTTDYTVAGSQITFTKCCWYKYTRQRFNNSTYDDII
jgi:hypothetical protein